MVAQRQQDRCGSAVNTGCVNIARGHETFFAPLVIVGNNRLVAIAVNELVRVSGGVVTDLKRV